MTTRGDKRGEAIAYARRTTGTILWCGVGVFSGDGRKALDPRRAYDVPEETRRFLAQHCVRYTPAETAAAASRAHHQEARCQRLAKLAIDASKYASAIKLCSKAEALQDTVKEYAKGQRAMYRMK